MKKHHAHGGMLKLLALTLLVLASCSRSVDQKAPATPATGNRPLTTTAATVTSAPVTTVAPVTPPPEIPPAVPTSKEATPGQPPRLRNLKLTLPMGWEARYSVNLVEWTVTKGAPPDYPEVYITTILRTREPRDLAEFAQKALTNPDTRGMGYRWVKVTEKGELPDGFYVVGPVKLNTDKAPRGTGFAMVRALGGQKLLFQCFKINDAAQRKEAMEWCKTASF
jgi:hypothetical protein